jgi:hypothetical protein
MNHQRIRFANRAASEVRRLVQVRQRRVIRQLRPKGLDHLLAVQPMPTCQRKHLYQLRATPMLPGLLRHNTAIPQHLKPTEQAHLEALHQTIFSPNDDARKSATMNSPAAAQLATGSSSVLGIIHTSGTSSSDRPKHRPTAVRVPPITASTRTSSAYRQRIERRQASERAALRQFMR